MLKFIHYLIFIIGSISGAVLLLRVAVGVFTALFLGKVGDQKMKPAHAFYNLCEAACFFYVVFLLIEAYLK